MRRWLPAALLALSVGLTACSSGEEATRDESGAVASEGSVDAFELEVGDCTADPVASGGETEVVESVTAVPCDQPHDGEAYHAFDLPDGEFPGDEQSAAAADEGCFAAFPDFVGKPFEESKYDYTFLSPTKESWDQLDDREVLCILVDGEGQQLTGSAKGSAL